MSHDAAPPDLASGRELGHRASSSQSSWASWSDSSSSLSETVSRLHGLLPTFLSAFDRSASQASAFLLRARVKDQEGATIDWAHENAKERARRTALSEVKGIRGIRARLWDSMTPWIVVVATGVTVGLLAASLDIVTAWLSDLRSGVCRDMYWAPKAICCTGLDPGEICHSWTTWADLVSEPGTRLVRRTLLSYALYLTLGTLFAFIASFFVRSYALWAKHTGIPEIKAILGGYILSDFLSTWTLVIKALGLPLAVASGLSLGKEGPLVHVACCVGNFFLQPFAVLRNNQARQRQLLSAAGAAGLSVAFGAPLGAVAFSLEEISSYFSVSVLWQSFVCAIVAAVTLQYLDPFGTGKLVLFQVTTSQVWRGFELIPFLLIGLLGGLWGALFVRMNASWERFRQASGMSDWPVSEVTCLALITAVISYPVMFLRIPSGELVANLFSDCSGPDTYGLCDSSQTSANTALLFITAFIKTILTVVTFGAALPAGVFLPSIVIGACVGRAVGLVVSSLQKAYPLARMFATCPADGNCINPPVYAVIGAASAATGVTRMTISLVVIMFELTGAIDLVLQIMLAVMVSKFVGDYFDQNGGIYEAWINLRGYPFLSSKIDYRRDSVLARDVMTKSTKIVAIPDEGWSVARLEALVEDKQYRGYPVIVSESEPLLMGYVSRLQLSAALRKAKGSRSVTADTPCFFSEKTRRGRQIIIATLPQLATDLDPAERALWELENELDDKDDETISRGLNSESAMRYSQDDRPPNDIAEGWLSLRVSMDEAPLTLRPEMPMQVVVDMFKRLGLRVLLFTTQGRLEGLVTKMDIHSHLHPGSDVRKNRQRSASRPRAAGAASSSRRRTRGTVNEET